MEVAKDIRPDDKNAGEEPTGLVVLSVAIRGGRGDGLPVVAFWVACLVAAGGLPGMAGRAMFRRRSAAVIRRYLISH